MNKVIRIRQEGPNILLIINGVATEMPWDAAIKLGQALIGKGHRAEEVAKVSQVAEDQAILHRAGIRIGLAVNPSVQKEAMKEAVNNTNLRRYLPHPNLPSGWVGAPEVRKLKEDD